MISFNNIAVCSIVFENPRVGQWVADIKFIGLNQEQIAKVKKGTKEKLVFDFEDQYFTGTVTDYRFNDPYHVIRVVAGDAVMKLPTKAKNIKEETSAKQATGNIVKDTGTNEPSLIVESGNVVIVNTESLGIV